MGGHDPRRVGVRLSLALPALPARGAATIAATIAATAAATIAATIAATGAATVLASVVAVPGHAAQPLQATAAAERSTCLPEYRMTAWPDVVLLGESVGVTITAKALCGERRIPLHLVLVLDGSGSMAEDGKSQRMKQAARRLVEGLELEAVPGTRVGVVEFNHQAFTRCPLSGRTTQVLAGISRIGTSGGTRIDAGILEGLKVLSQGRRGLDRERLSEVLLVLTDGKNNDGCEPVVRAALQARSQNVLVIAVCVGADCDEPCMRRVASSPRYYFRADNPEALLAVFQAILQRLANIVLKSLEVAVTLGDDMAYLAGSANPPQTQPPQPDTWLLWRETYVPREGLTYAYRVVPRRTGTLPLGLSTTGKLVDSDGLALEWRFDVPWVLVVQPDPLSVPVTPPPTVTVTPSATPTAWPTPPPTHVPSATPTPRPVPVYLPLLLREPPCAPRCAFPDVALVLDVSTSMERLTSGGRTKHEAVLEAVEVFVDAVPLEESACHRPGRVAVVGFHGRAFLELPLSGDRERILAAVRALAAHRSTGTRLDLAFQVGADALATGTGERWPAPVLVLLTDGLPNQVPAAEDGDARTTVLRAAEAARRRGIRVYTVGVGRTDPDAPLVEQVDAELLRACATDHDMFLHEPDAERLADVFARLARIENPCAGRHDWSRPWPPTPLP